MDEQGMFKVEFDGCQYGLMSIRRGMEDHFIKKPWAFASDMFEVAPKFQRICKGLNETHQHDTCNSMNAIHSQYYTPIMVTLLHYAVMEHFSNKCAKLWKPTSMTMPMKTSTEPTKTTDRNNTSKAQPPGWYLACAILELSLIHI